MKNHNGCTWTVGPEMKGNHGRCLINSFSLAHGMLSSLARLLLIPNMFSALQHFHCLPCIESSFPEYAHGYLPSWLKYLIEKQHIPTVIICTRNWQIVTHGPKQAN